MPRRIRRLGFAKHTAPHQAGRARPAALAERHRADRRLDAAVAGHALADTRHPGHYGNRAVAEDLAQRQCLGGIQASHSRTVRHHGVDFVTPDPRVIQRPLDRVVG